MSWPAVGMGVAALVIAGIAAVSRQPRRARAARLAFTAATVLVLARAGWWLAVEVPGVSVAARAVVALAIAGISGAWWIAAVRWAGKP